MIIVPAIDIMNGKLVRLTEGDYAQQKEYNLDVFDTARSFEDMGFTHLHLVDLDGARERKIKNLPILEKIASKTTLKIDFSGGINSLLDAKTVFSAGANQICIGTLAIKQKEVVLEISDTYQPEKIILSPDVKHDFVYINGWKTKTNMTLVEYIKTFKKLGFVEFMSTNILKDGKLKGIDVGLYQNLTKLFPELSFIASGGVTTLEDIRELRNIKIKKVIVGKALYENRIDLKVLAEF